MVYFKNWEAARNGVVPKCCAMLRNVARFRWRDTP